MILQSSLGLENSAKTFHYCHKKPHKILVREIVLYFAKAPGITTAVKNKLKTATANFPYQRFYLLLILTNLTKERRIYLRKRKKMNT